MLHWLRKQIVILQTAQQRGFTLVEMVVVAAIFGVLTLIVVFKYGDFTSNILVTNMAYEIAMTTRQAQVFGVGARGFDIGDGDGRGFTFPYGVFFTMNDGTTPDNTTARSFNFFVDRDDDMRCTDTGSSGVCTCGNATDECVEKLTLQRNIRITQLRTSAFGRDDGSCEQPSEMLAVTFMRPSPEARIIRQGVTDVLYDFAQIKVEAVGSDLQPAYVLIRQTGQISVSNQDICNPSGA